MIYLATKLIDGKEYSVDILVDSLTEAKKIAEQKGLVLEGKLDSRHHQWNFDDEKN